MAPLDETNGVNIECMYERKNTQNVRSTTENDDEVTKENRYA